MQNITPKIISVGASDPDRKLFDELIPLPDGTSYNSYLIFGSQKTALIDTVDPTKHDVLIKNLEKSAVKKIDYIIAHHAEQDHSGSLPNVLKKFPGAKVVCTEKCKQMLIDLLEIPESSFQVVKDKEILSLGDKSLEFIFTPWVHWPETMCTYLKEDKILFSCDFFGSHFATESLLDHEDKSIYLPAKRYFAEIMYPFRSFIKSNLAKLSTYKIEMIAPSHGPIYKNPKYIIDAYTDWISDKVKNLAIICYISMHSSTRIAAEHLATKLKSSGVEVHLYNLTNADIGEIAISLVDAATIVVGSPCVLNGIHPSVASAVYLVNALRPKAKFVSVIGSFGWGSRIVEEISPMIKNIRAEVIAPVIIKGIPKANDLEQINLLADAIASRHKVL